MIQTAINYAKVLYELEISKDLLEETKDIFKTAPELMVVLANPIIPKKNKHNIIEKTLPKEVHSFFKVLCDYSSIDLLDEIFAAYKKVYNEKNDILEVSLTYVTAPNEKQLDGIKELLMKKYHKEKIELSLIEDPAILGGFIIKTQNCETDWSIRGRLEQLQQRLVRR